MALPSWLDGQTIVLLGGMLALGVFLHTGFAGVRQDIECLRQDLECLRQDIENLRTALKSDIEDHSSNDDCQRIGATPSLQDGRAEDDS